jgi:hypothetical protein
VTAKVIKTATTMITAIGTAFRTARSTDGAYFQPKPT